MNLLRRGGYRSIRRGLGALYHDIKGMLALGGVQVVENGSRINFQAALRLHPIQDFIQIHDRALPELSACLDAKQLPDHPPLIQILLARLYAY